MTTDPEHRSLSQNLNDVLARAKEDSISLGEILEGVGDKGFGILLVILSLPSALPVPAPGYSTPFGILLGFLSIQMIFMRQHPVLPKFALKRSLSRVHAEKLFKAANSFLKRFEKIIHPRMRWIGLPAGRAALGWLTLLMSCLMILPIPLTNTAPAAVIFLIGVGISEDDGFFALGSFAMGLVAAAFYAVIIYLLLTLGMEGINVAKEWIMAALGR